MKAGTDALQSPTSGAGRRGRRGVSGRALAAEAHYIAGLGYLGLKETAKAKTELTRTLGLRPDHLAAKTALEQMY